MDQAGYTPNPFLPWQDDHMNVVKNIYNGLDIGFLKHVGGTLRPTGPLWELFGLLVFISLSALKGQLPWTVGMTGRTNSLSFPNPTYYLLWLVDARNFQSNLDFLICQIGGNKE